MNTTTPTDCWACSIERRQRDARGKAAAPAIDRCPIHRSCAAEREDTVAWLRSFEAIRGGTLGAEEDADHEALLMVLADAIERGDHDRR